MTHKLSLRKTRRRLVRYGLLSFYVVLLGATVVFVLHGSSSAGQTPDKKMANAATAPATSAPANPLDQLSSADIALQVAQLDHLPEATPVRNQADSQQAVLAMMSASSDVTAKSQVVATSFASNKDIKVYTAQAGDTVSSIAAKYHVTADSVRWSNDMSGESVDVGQKLYIPPVDGIVYKVKSGDTVDSLAQTYKARKDQIIFDNDAEISGIHEGELIIIPNGQITPAPAAPTYTATTYGTYAPYGFTASFGGLGTCYYNGRVYSNYGYDCGYCTWYAAMRSTTGGRAVPSNWGDAVSWAYYAGLSGWTVSSHPVPGAIAQTPAGYAGHVAIVEAVSPDGSQIKYSDMNGIAGFGRVGYSGWVPASYFPNYLY